MCTFNFRPKFRRLLPSPFWPNFSAVLYPQEICDFWPKIRVNFFWIFFHKSVLGSPDITLGNFQVHPSDRSQAETSGKLASTSYFNKLLPSIFWQVRRQERAILASTYYTLCVHSILGQNFDIARRRHFGQFFRPYYTLRKFVIFIRKSRSIFFGFCLQISVLGSHYNTLSKLQVHPRAESQAETSGKLASTIYFNKLLPSIFLQVRRHWRAILASTYYTGCVHSILGQTFDVARRRHSATFSAILYPQEICDFWPKIRVNFFWIFFHKSVQGSPDITLGNFQVHPSPRSQAETSGKLASIPYFNKLLHSIFWQVRRQERAILASTYSTGCVHSILGQIFDVARRRHFGQFFSAILYAQEICDFWSKIKVNFFWIFFHKSVLGSPDITLGNFQVHPSDRSQAETSGKLESTSYFNKLLPSIFWQVRRQERAILASTYYTGCVHSILGQNFDVTRRRHFGQFFRPYYNVRKFAIFGRKSRSIFF